MTTGDAATAATPASPRQRPAGGSIPPGNASAICTAGIPAAAAASIATSISPGLAPAAIDLTMAFLIATALHCAPLMSAAGPVIPRATIAPAASSPAVPAARWTGLRHEGSLHRWRTSG
jgi:hypothetical protein